MGQHLQMVSGMGQPPEFSSSPLPLMNVTIGAGQSGGMVTPDMVGVGQQFPLSGEAVLVIDPATGVPMWKRTTPIADVKDQYWFDIRDELQMRSLPDWVVRRERDRREQLLRDTSASGAMRTALAFDEPVALPAGWTQTNMF
jgi:hypothetical protein